DVRTQELTELSNAVNHMAECLETQEAIRRRLTSDVAHELRTPIANVSSHLEAIIEGVWEPTTERLQSCYDELGRISDIISDLEKLRQIEDENMILEKEPVDLLELSQTVQYAFEQELDKKQLKCKVSGESAVVSGDQKRLHQVIFNLVSNAIKYSTEGGCININVRNETDTATLIIKDQGIGISEKDLPLIFERFYRTDRSRNRKMGGAGIGLTIAKAVVLAHNGKITVESKEGYGSRFVITVPKR
uniref:sensor histidine kinase n=2 Tax=Lachnospirales TaxID=3085636 RepID=UPI0034A13A35